MTMFTEKWSTKMTNEDDVEETTSITLKNCYGQYTVLLKKTDMDLPQVVDLLIIPLLLAAGYHQDNINDLFNQT